MSRDLRPLRVLSRLSSCKATLGHKRIEGRKRGPEKEGNLGERIKVRRRYTLEQLSEWQIMHVLASGTPNTSSSTTTFDSYADWEVLREQGCWSCAQLGRETDIPEPYAAVPLATAAAVSGATWAPARMPLASTRPSISFWRFSLRESKCVSTQAQSSSSAVDIF